MTGWRPKVNDRFVMAAGWQTNAEAIVGAARLWWNKGDRVVDVTYGEGKFWTLWRPPDLVCHDLYKLDGVDFRDMPEQNGTYQISVLDPAYVVPGGLETTSVADLHDRYGMGTTEKNPSDQRRVIRDGIVEQRRVIAEEGLLFYKVMNYVSSGIRHHCVRWAYDDLDDLGFNVVDEFYVLNNGGPQSQDTQIHARNNISTLIVARKR